MSAVTPRGASQRSTDPRRRARRRHALTLLIALLFVVAAGWYGWNLLRGNAEGTEVLACPAPTDPAVPLVPGQVQVNVYNATDRAGLARNVATELQARGFVVGAVDNDPLNAEVPPPAVVRHGTTGQRQAELMASVVAGGAQLVLDERPGPEVDLVIGLAYAGLAPPPPSPDPAAAPAPAPTC